jgi:ligand-binding SRPBCC domain-containing protein
MRYHFHTEQWLPYSIEHVFAFFGDPDNLPRLMPGWQKARIEAADIKTPIPPLGITTQTARLAGAGARITLSFRPIPFLPMRATWIAEIDQFAWNDHFCDTQLRGPFAFWHHCHRVSRESRQDAKGARTDGTLLRDELEYELPFGVFGSLAHRIAVRRQIESIFHYRHRRTEQLMSVQP